jgi:hypothetical protein
MRAEQWWWNATVGWNRPIPEEPRQDIDLVLVFFATALVDDTSVVDELRRCFPEAILFGCSTAGEIRDVRVQDLSLVATAVSFEATTVRGKSVVVGEGEASRSAGRELASALLDEDLVHLLVLSDGLHVNGSELIAGILDVLPERVTISGGLAGDGENMGRTLVMLGDSVEERRVAAVGFYGDRLVVGCGSLGGWDPFGPERKITRSEGNVLYELDGHSALELYKKFLGERAAELPASALLFPLSLRTPDGSEGIVRTILAIDEEAGSMTFAGDLPEGAWAKLMKANFERLIDGAMGAARISVEGHGAAPCLALLVSCVGRKLVLQQRIEEEVEAVREVLGDGPTLAGFYSLGEISPFAPRGRCELHNQTMTITTLAET